jgi:hypothetical protein
MSSDDEMTEAERRELQQLQDQVQFTSAETIMYALLTMAACLVVPDGERVFRQVEGAPTRLRVEDETRNGVVWRREILVEGIVLTPYTAIQFIQYLKFLFASYYGFTRNFGIDHETYEYDLQRDNESNIIQNNEPFPNRNPMIQSWCIRFVNLRLCISLKHSQDGTIVTASFQQEEDVSSVEHIRRHLDYPTDEEWLKWVQEGGSATPYNCFRW